MVKDDSLFNVKVNCVNSTNLYNVRFKHRYNKQRLKTSIFDSFLVCIALTGVFFIVYFAYNVLVL
ncbi:MAG: hypothetical protein SOV27_00830 [Eubacteriales bacterium]|nr:hypothetical protein [Eubacteriales bacterium]